MSSTCFETEGSSSGRRLYIQLRYGTFYMHEYKQSSMQDSVFFYLLACLCVSNTLFYLLDCLSVSNTLCYLLHCLCVSITLFCLLDCLCVFNTFFSLLDCLCVSITLFCLLDCLCVSNALFYLLNCLYRPCTTNHTVAVYTTVILKMNPRVRNMQKT